MRKVLPTLIAVVLLQLFFSLPSAQAQVKPGIRAGAYFDANSGFIGGELLFGVNRHWFIDPNVEYVFVDNGHMMTFNFDVHRDLNVTGPLYVWVGAGPAIVWRDPDRGQGHTDFGLNIFGGIGFRTHSELVPYIQPKVIISNDSDFSLAFGLRF